MSTSTPRKPSTLPVKAPEDPYTLAIKAPGHSAITVKFWKDEELTPRLSRRLTVLNQFMLPKFRSALRAHQLITGGTMTREEIEEVNPADIELSYEDVDNSVLLGELAAATYVKSWTLKRTKNEQGESIPPEPWPLPRDETGAPDPGALLDLPGPIYVALIGHASKLWRMANDSEFTIDGIENPDSPTGASAD